MEHEGYVSCLQETTRGSCQQFATCFMVRNWYPLTTPKLEDRLLSAVRGVFFIVFPVTSQELE